MNQKIKYFLYIFIILFLIINFNGSKDIRVNINSNPTGAYFTIEGNPQVLSTPIQIKFRQGVTYKLTFTKDGYNPKTISYVGGSGDIMVTLESGNIFIPMNYTLTVNSNINGATVYINNQQYGTTPFSISLNQGTYSITVRYSGYTDYNTSVFLNTNKTVNAILTGGTKTLTVTSNVNNADVYINGQKYGNTPLTISLNPGVYNLTVKANGYNDFNTSINLTSNQNVHAELVKNTLSLKVTSNINGADVYINGSRYGVTPLTVFLASGTYSVTVKYSGYRDFNTTLNLTSDKTLYAQLDITRYIKINLPKGASISINDIKQLLDWGNTNDGGWKIFTFYSEYETNKVIIKYHGIVVEKNIKFNNNTVSLIFDIQ